MSLFEYLIYLVAIVYVLFSNKYLYFNMKQYFSDDGKAEHNNNNAFKYIVSFHEIYLKWFGSDRYIIVTIDDLKVLH